MPLGTRWQFWTDDDGCPGIDSSVSCGSTTSRTGRVRSHVGGVRDSSQGVTDRRYMGLRARKELVVAGISNRLGQLWIEGILGFDRAAASCPGIEEDGGGGASHLRPSPSPGSP